MINELTVIITFRNEGEEVERTILEIKRTAGNAVNIVLVNDASEDDYDYGDLKNRYTQIRYLENQQRIGCAASRDIGIDACETPFFLIIDGHMRFYNDHWWSRFVDEIKSDFRAIYCCRCRIWDFETKKEKDIPMPFGAYVHLSNIDGSDFFDTAWITMDIFDNDHNVVDIPCVLGACYAASKDYWKLLRGLEGLRLYSCDEAYLSMKAWMEGGRCRLLKDVAIGHLFREKFPYKVSTDEFIYNRLFIALSLLPNDLKDIVWQKIRLAEGCVNFAKVKRLINLNINEIEELKNHFSNVLKMDFNRFEKINNEVIEKIKRCKDSW